MLDLPGVEGAFAEGRSGYAGSGEGDVGDGVKTGGVEGPEGSVIVGAEGDG